jgi:hypothetical protein
MFHKFLSTDNEVDNSVVITDEDTEIVEVTCLGCGVVTAEFVTDFVSVNHATLPLTCPGPTVQNPHHFHAVTSAIGGIHNIIECGWCDYVIEDDTLPADVEWECSYTGDERI